MIKYVITIGLSKYEFESYEKAVTFALTALESQKDNDDITMKFIKEE